MEPCSIVEAASTTLGLCKTLYEFFSAVAAAEEEIQHLTTQLGDFSRLLPLIGQYENGTHDSELSALELLSREALWGILRNCTLDFKNLYEAVRDCTPHDGLPALRKLKRKFSWVLERDQIQNFATRLANAKQNLMLALQVSGRTNELRTLNMVSEVKDAVDSQDRKAAELLRSLERFLPLLEKASQEYNRSFERLEAESKTRLDDLSESMSGEFYSFQGEDQAPEPFTAECDSDREDAMEAKFHHNGGDDTKLKLRRSSTFAENEAELRESTELFTKRFSEMNVNTRVVGQSSTSSVSDVIKELESSKLASHSKVDSKRVRSFLHSWESCAKMFPNGMALSSSVETALLTILKISLDSKETNALIMEGIVETGDTLRLCQREYALYPTSEIRNAMANLYATTLQFLSRCMQILRSSQTRKAAFILNQNQISSEIEARVAEIRKISHEVKEKVEYQHKVEMKDMSQRVQMIEKDQQKILARMQYQMKILQTLKDQRSVVVVMKEQEEILLGIEKVVIKMQRNQINPPDRAEKQRS